ncbi:MAG: rRNA maturation RNase YbeY [Candidatus Pacebacteria bacterium]|nr:rRNA maturation RNase YbeY [Candidatus Paceibacterota bacterium]
MGSVSIHNSTRQQNVVAGLPFAEVAKKVVPGWDISLAFVGSTKARALNMQLRKKEYVPNVLSYVVGNKSAEIIICPTEAAKQAPDFKLPASSFLLLLFIHGLLHIKGMAHGVTMEQCERKLVATFVTGDARPLPNETTHRNRNRHRHLSGEDGRRRRSRL